jgi:hypothetical protein
MRWGTTVAVGELMVNAGKVREIPGGGKSEPGKRVTTSIRIIYLVLY